MQKVNVIITCYNKEKTIARAIETVKRQTLEEFFCVVVDDGSTDNSWEIINNAIENDKRFSAIKLENCGVANARNKGIELCKAQYITCLDGDDGIQPEFLETCYNAITKLNGVGVVYTDILLSHPDSYFTVARWPEPQPELQFERKNQIPCCNMFRRDVFEKVGGYRQRYAPRGAGAEDAELWLRFFKTGYTAKKITNEPLFIYSAFGGLTQNNHYNEVNWVNWHTTKPLASLEESDTITHIINEYDRPEISVVIPVGPGHEHYLIDALDSLESQTFTNWEAIVIFDIEDSALNGVCGNYYETVYPYVKFIYTSGGLGAGAARNLGINEAKGKYITFLDADDHLQPKFLEFTKSAIEHFKADWVYTDLYTQTIYNEEQFKLKVTELDNQGLLHQILKEKNGAIEFIYPYECSEFSVDQLFNGGVAAVTALYKKSDLLEVEGFDEINNREDWDLHFRLAKAGKCGLRLPLPLFTYRLHTGTRREYKYDEAIDFETGKKIDKERLYKLYDYEELKMGCSSCRKNKITIKPATTNDLTTLEYVAKNTGGSVRGITGKSYHIEHIGNKYILQKVHPQDAEVFLNKGLTRKMATQKTKQNIIVSPTPQKVKVVEMSREERLAETNRQLLEQRKQVEIEVEAYFNNQPETKTTDEDMLPDYNNWYNLPEMYNGNMQVLKHHLDRHPLTEDILNQVLKNEQNGKNRKGAKKLIKSMIDKLGVNKQ